MVDLTTTAMRLLGLYGPLALLLFTFLETSMLFPFLPSEAVVPAAAALLVTDLPSFLVFVGAATVGGTVGAFVPFYVFHDTRVGDNGWLQRHIHVSDERIERGEVWFRRWGRSSVLWGRLLPVLRSVVSIPAGFVDMRPLRFGAYTAVGTVLFYAATAGVVYYARERSLFATAIAVATERPLAAAVVAVAVVGVTVLLWRWSPRRALSG
ncbi:hypothetical protein BV210_00335 [Halorientalis sp. IM1011]|uniref:DedA family protein n=1 Tax=Halorientalis sp. IM1011 TaxID=1932360 RepID=UPI00097CC4BF|nr:VTT domain-containing protein [Halorientalis sp. IM1011]AQL41251.1 hypothetical protein BV210_00335 [Halorientalis sp. IM1011]